MLREILHSADHLFNSEGAWWILALDGILAIPLIFAVFFYPVAVVGGVVILAACTILAMIVVRRVHARRASAIGRSAVRKQPHGL